MTDPQITDFLEIFQTLARVFPLRGDQRELTDVSRAYFKALRRFSLGQVKGGADYCIERLPRFPKPAEWIAQIPRQTAEDASIPALTHQELAEYRSAERKHWGDEPCRCQSCRAGGVDHRFLRFVPDDPEERVRIDDYQTTVRGHWAHGDELRRWYGAKERFWAEFREAVQNKTLDKKQKRKRIPFEERIERIFKGDEDRPRKQTDSRPEWTPYREPE